MLRFIFILKAAVIPSVTIAQDQESADDSERSEETEAKKKAIMEQKENEERMRESAPAAKGEGILHNKSLSLGHKAFLIHNGSNASDDHGGSGDDMVLVVVMLVVRDCLLLEGFIRIMD